MRMAEVKSQFDYVANNTLSHTDVYRYQSISHSCCCCLKRNGWQLRHVGL